MLKKTPAENRVAELERELAGTQEMLAFVLKVAGTVVVPKEYIDNGLGAEVQIQVDDDLQRDAFVFTLVEV